MTPSAATPSISLVVATYNVGAYLPEFLAAIERQDSPLDSVEFVFVDDGSTDDSAALVEAWRAAHPDLRTHLIGKTNGGPASARNAGLEVATGEWVTFPDPDDVLSDGYLGELIRFVGSEAADRVHLVVGRFVYLHDDTGSTSDTHPLRFRFNQGTRVVDLGRLPHYIHVATNTGVYRRAVLDRFDLRFDPGIRPVWEDGHLTARYLSKFERPRLALLADAIYYYRRRSDGSSLMDGQWRSRGKFVDVPRAWLDVLRIAAADHGGQVPPWIANIVLYDLLGPFRQERRTPSPTAATPPEVSDEFFAIVDEIMQFIDVETLDAFRVTGVSTEIRLALRMHFKGCDPRPAEIFLDRIDRARGLVRLRWYYSGEAPRERFTSRGFVVDPVYAKTRPSTFYGRTLAYERIVWLPADATTSVWLDDVRTPLRTGPLHLRQLALKPDEIWTGITGESPDTRRTPVRRPGLRGRLGRARQTLDARVERIRGPRDPELRAAARTMRAARSLPGRGYRDAWLLMDRRDRAGDNAEQLYRYLRREQKGVNAWFVLDRACPDWDRLAADGVRLLEYGSREHLLALLNCRYLVSSHLDDGTDELLGAEYGDADRWQRVYLQHGVTKDDESIVLNRAPIELMTTATPAEHRAIVDDSSPYVWSEREVRLTGFARHDRLLSLAAERGRTAPRLVLVMPTWRRDLLTDPAGFWTSGYAAQWRSVLESDRLRAAAEQHGLRIVFVPHPALQDHLDGSPLPAHVEVHRFRDTDVQQLLADAAVLVTDYSSTAFEAAYLERPIVYFQFDRDTFFDGRHSYRRGSWSYERDGFGPVTVDPDAAVDAVLEILARDGAPEPAHAERMAAAFAYRDGESARRTYEAIADLARPLRGDDLFCKVESPDVLAGRTVADELGS